MKNTTIKINKIRIQVKIITQSTKMKITYVMFTEKNSESIQPLSGLKPKQTPKTTLLRSKE